MAATADHRPKKGTATLPQWFMELAPLYTLHVEEGGHVKPSKIVSSQRSAASAPPQPRRSQRRPAEGPSSSSLKKGTGVLPQWWMDLAPYDTLDDSLYEDALLDSVFGSQSPHKSKTQQRKQSEVEPIQTYAEIHLNHSQKSSPNSSLTHDSGSHHNPTSSSCSSSWEMGVKKSESYGTHSSKHTPLNVAVAEDGGSSTSGNSSDYSSTPPASQPPTLSWIQEQSAIPRLETSEDDTAEQENEQQRHPMSFRSKEGDEICEVKSAPPGYVSYSKTSKPKELDRNSDDVSDTMSTTHDGDLSDASSIFVDKSNGNRPQAPKQSSGSGRASLSVKSADEALLRAQTKFSFAYSRIRPLDESMFQRKKRSSKTSAAAVKENDPPKEGAAKQRAEHPSPQSPSKEAGRKSPRKTRRPNSTKSTKPKLLFAGRNFNPGSDGWDPKVWGIDASDPDYQSYQDGVKLPKLYVDAVMKYAKAIGIIDKDFVELSLSSSGSSSPESGSRKRSKPPIPSASSKSTGKDNNTEKQQTEDVAASPETDTTPKIVWQIVDRFNDMMEC